MPLHKSYDDFFFWCSFVVGFGQGWGSDRVFCGHFCYQACAHKMYFVTSGFLSFSLCLVWASQSDPVLSLKSLALSKVISFFNANLLQ